MTRDEPDEPVDSSSEGPNENSAATWSLQQHQVVPQQLRNQLREALRQMQTPDVRLGITKILADGPIAQLSHHVNMMTSQLRSLTLPVGSYNFGFVSSINSAAYLSRILPDYRKLLASLTPQVSFHGFAELFLTYQPANWRSVIGEDVHTIDLLDLARDGFPITWVPGPVVLRALVVAEEEQRQQVLLSHEEQCLVDCAEVLGMVIGGPHDPLARLLEQAIFAIRASLPAPAQALAANVLDTVLRMATSQWRGYKVWLKHHSDDDDFTLGELRYAATMAPMRLALKEFWEQKGQPVPVSFNRHATSHAVGDIQYSNINALISVMLATSIVREFHEQHLELDERNDAEKMPDAS